MTSSHPSPDRYPSKDHIDHIERSNEIPMHDPQEVGRILRKMDWRILPFLAVPYLLSYMDRGNIGNAKVAGMNTDMGLTDKQYNICLMVFFFTYSLFEVPSNIVLKLMPPSRWIGIMMLGWGTAMTLQGLVRQYSHLIATRLVLGLFEAGLFPAATYLLTTWYCRFELQTRMSIFFAAASLAGAFSGILAFAISKMNGIGGLEGWRWIFILEGLLTIVVAVVIPFVLPDSPETAKFLSDDEKAIVIHRLRHDSGTESGIVGTGEKFQWKYLIAAMLDWKLYLSIFIYWGHSIPIYAFTFTAPTIIRQLGYSAANAQLLTIPVYFFGALTTVVVSRLADRYKCRWVFITGAYAVSTVAFIGLLAIPHPRLPGLTYALLFLITGGLYPAIIGLIAWIANNLAPSWKRAVGMAFLMGFGNLGGAVSSNIFIASQAPHYWIGYGMCLALVVVAILATVVMRVTLSKINRQRDALDEDEIRAMYSDAQLVEMGDRSPLVRYVL